MKRSLDVVILALIVLAPIGLAFQLVIQSLFLPEWMLLVWTVLLGWACAVRYMIEVRRLAREPAPEAGYHEFSLIGTREEDTLRLADAWMIVAELMDECEGSPEELSQDRVIHALNALDAAVKGEERCIEPREFFERRTMALARMREKEGRIRD